MFTDYDSEVRIHDGARHQVYRARRRSDGRPVILKLLKEDLPSVGDIERFRVEYQFLASVDSPFVVRALDFTEDRGRWLLVMEDIGGRRLTDFIRAADVGLRERLDVAVALLSAVQDVHDAGLIHKDVNPHNIVWNRSTRTVKLIDFGLSTPLTSETPAFTSTRLLEGTLAYLAPEQSGRVRASLDSRADLYAVGATLYELFTGVLPFPTDDPLDLVYSHLARRPAPPSHHRPDLPPMLDTIVLRLLEKRPADRYQTAFGVLRDLERCRATLDADGRIPAFEPGADDHKERFELSNRLYGRQEALAKLLEAFEAATSDQAEGGRLVSVGAPTGMGKTALIRELYHPLTRHRGIFVSGKPDQFNRLPLAPIASAFDELVEQVLAVDESTLRGIVEGLRDALGPGAGVLTEIVPRISNLLGDLPPPEEVPAQEQKNRQIRVCRDFVRFFASPRQPVVLFFDDLQWADAATLEIIESLVVAGHPGLLVIGAYRDDEVDHAHPLTAILDRLDAAGVVQHRIELPPLSESHVVEMLTESTGEPPEAVAGLARLTLRYTGGNPLWAREYLQALATDGLLRFDRETGHWAWDLAEIGRRGFTTSVLEFIASRLERLPADCLEVVQVAACVGSRFDLPTVAAVTGRSTREVFDALLPALNSGVIVATSATEALLAHDAGQHRQCSFFHDRIQQAAAGMLDEASLARLHHRIGRYMLEQARPEERGDRIFEIVTQLDAGLDLVPPGDERIELAELNLQAGRKARQASAFDAAARYLAAGLRCLPADPWVDHAGLALALHREHALASAMTGDADRADSLSAIAAAHAPDPITRAEILAERAYQLTHLGRYADAVAAMREGLTQVGIDFPADDALPQAMGELHASLQERMGDARPLDLLDRPTMQDPQARAAVALLGAGLAPSFYISPELYTVVILQALNVCLEHGNPPHSFNLYACYGHLLSGVFGDRQGGHDFGRLAVELCDRTGSLRDKAASAFITANFAASWVQPLSRQQALNEAGFQAGVESGDLVYAAYILCYIGHNAFYAGHRLEDVASRTDDHARFHARIGNPIAMDVTDALRLVVRNLRGRTGAMDEFSLPDLDEASFRARAQANQSVMALCYLDIFKAEALLRYGEPAAALAALDAAAPLLPTIMNNHGGARHAFLTALALCRIAGSESAVPSEGDAPDTDARLDALAERLEGWARTCPENFAHLAAMVRAERARSRQADGEAIEAYDQAILLAERHGFSHDLAWACELAARFWLSQQSDDQARALWERARYVYALWGAQRKVELLDSELPDRVRDAGEHAGTWRGSRTGSSSTDLLDVTSVIRASQALSGEIRIDRLLRQLMELVVQNAGAQRGALLIDDEERLRIEAMGQLVPHDDEQRLEVRSGVGTLADLPDELPRAIIGYVARTGEPVILADAAVDPRFAQDPYVARHRPHSVLCMPVLRHGERIGLLYLENREITGAFTDEQLGTLRLLATQFAISFENARLYQQMEDKVEQRTAELAAKNRELEATLHRLRTTQDQLIHAEKMASLGQLTAGVAHEINNPLNFVNNFALLGNELVEDLAGILDAPESSREEARKVLAELRRGLEAIHAQGTRAADIVSSMLRHARRSGEEREPIDLNLLVSKYVDLAQFGLRNTLKDVRVDVELDLADDLPSLTANPQELGRVVVNLLNNAHDAVAARAADAGPGYRGRIVVRTRQVGDGVEFRITDNGTGVPAELRDRIFEPFFTTKAGASGTGLGLSLSWDIVTQGHGGTLVLDSDVEEGAAFVVTLPLAPPS
ncbi:MAG: GAF domain-containing protein [Deltaproteobacteria bacterium]|nr:MAG: GAF domain-containing protein [Deltaproteobacteria bacterium]